MPSVDNDWEPVVWTSPDADHWTLSRDMTTAVVWSAPFTDVTWGNGRFVALDAPEFHGDFPVFTSADGLSWRPDTMTVNLPWVNAVTSGPGEFVAVGPEYMQTSADGRQWTVFAWSGCGNGVVWDGARYVAVGTSICTSK